MTAAALLHLEYDRSIPGWTHCDCGAHADHDKPAA